MAKLWGQRTIKLHSSGMTQDTNGVSGKPDLEQII
jgi:hypothetical protein